MASKKKSKKSGRGGDLRSSVWKYLRRHGRDGAQVLRDAAELAIDEGRCAHDALHYACQGASPIAVEIARAWMTAFPQCYQSSYEEQAARFLAAAQDVETFRLRYWPEPEPVPVVWQHVDVRRPLGSIQLGWGF